MAAPAAVLYGNAASDLSSRCPGQCPFINIVHKPTCSAMQCENEASPATPVAGSLTEPMPAVRTVTPSRLRGRTTDVAGAAIDGAGAKRKRSAELRRRMCTREASQQEERQQMRLRKQAGLTCEKPQAQSRQTTRSEATHEQQAAPRTQAATLFP